MESRVLKLAICYFGKKDEREKVLDLARKKFSNYEVTLFASIGEDKAHNLWKASLQKRNYEIENQIEFDVCVGVCSTNFVNFNNTNINELVKNKVYYTSGYYLKAAHRTGAHLNIFYCQSIEFDRVAEFFHSVKSIDTGLTKESEQFFYHLKTLNFDTECINYENSSLFIRSA
jgi:hypothetical protein